VTEKFRTKNEYRTTDVAFSQADLGLTVLASKGSFTGAPANRSYRILYHGLSGETAMYFNETAITKYSSLSGIPSNQNGAVWDANKKLLTVHLSSKPVDNSFKVANVQTRVRGWAWNRSFANGVRIFQDRIVVNSAVPTDMRLSIHRLNGSLVHSFAAPSRLTGSVRVFSLRPLSLSKGIYLVKITMNNAEYVRQFTLRQ
jgi:hypothetical protein